MHTLSIGALCWAIALPGVAGAEEPLFGFAYTTDLLPQGKVETAQWVSWRHGKPVGEYDVLEARTEIEYGVSDQLQLAAYFNYTWARAFHDSVIDGSTLAPAALSNVNVGPDDRLDMLRFNGVSLEVIYRLTSPYTDALGLALYVRPTIGPQYREVEARLILQRNFIDDRLVAAINVGMVDDWRYVPAGAGIRDSNGFDHPWDEQSTLSLAAAASYRLASGLSAGMECVNERGYVGANAFATSDRTQSAVYAGPALHYADRHLFATLTYLTQLPFARDHVHAEPDYVVGGRSYAAGFERLRVRLKFGWYF